MSLEKMDMALFLRDCDTFLAMPLHQHPNLPSPPAASFAPPRPPAVFLAPPAASPQQGEASSEPPAASPQQEEASSEPPAASPQLKEASSEPRAALPPEPPAVSSALVVSVKQEEPALAPRAVHRLAVINLLQRYRQLVAAENERYEKEQAESGMAKTRKPRFDLRVAGWLQQQQMWLNSHRQWIGHVPGVEVGDTFVSRAEMRIVNLHSESQAGIDVLRRCDAWGPLQRCVAVAVVAVVDSKSSIPYKDDQDMGDEVVYSGEGGMSMASGGNRRDQLPSRRNAGLIESHKQGTPVRLIRGYRTSPIAHDSPCKVTYSYDGLYLVKDVRYEVGECGNLVYKFLMVRMKNQLPLVLYKELKIPSEYNNCKSNSKLLCSPDRSTNESTSKSAWSQPKSQDHLLEGADSSMEVSTVLDPAADAITGLGGVFGGSVDVTGALGAVDATSGSAEADRRMVVGAVDVTSGSAEADSRMVVSAVDVTSGSAGADRELALVPVDAGEGLGCEADSDGDLRAAAAAAADVTGLRGVCGGSLVAGLAEADVNSTATGGDTSDAVRKRSSLVEPKTVPPKKIRVYPSFESLLRH